MLPALLAAAIPALIGAGVSAWGTQQTNQAADATAVRQMEFQKETLKHQYQWGMEDMRKAGLNPILAYKQGGAGTASGSTYTPQNVGAAAVQGASTAASSALAARAQETQLENIAADTRLKNSQDKTQAALQVQALAQAQQANSQTALNSAVQTRTNVDTLISTENLQSAKAAAARAAADEELLNTPEGRIARQFGTVARELGLVQGR